jgi:hypothetical protein
VELKDTINDFKGVLDGKYDDLPEMAFYMVGPVLLNCTARLYRCAALRVGAGGLLPGKCISLPGVASGRVGAALLQWRGRLCRCLCCCSGSSLGAWCWC